MIIEKKIVQNIIEMVVHVNGTAHFLNALIGGKFVMQKQVYGMADYVLVQTKRNIESYPLASQEE